MPEAEEVLQDVARHATVYARELWRRHRKAAPGPARVDLRDVAQRLDLLLAAAFGRAFPLRVADPPVPPTLLTRVFRRNEGPPVQAALPATDGVAIWLPGVVPDDGALPGAELFRIGALRQAMRAVRGSPAAWRGIVDPLVAACFLAHEAHAADVDLVRLLPGTRASVLRLRAWALAARPVLERFPAHRRGLELQVRALLHLREDAWQPRTVDEVLAQAREDAGALVQRTTGRLLYRDAWVGEFRAAPAQPSGYRAADADARDDGDAATPPRSARLDRTPQVRQAPEDEDDRGQGAWMVQTGEPQEKAEDPMGMQRPTDRDASTASEEFADALSELPEARLVSSPGAPKEVLLSDAPPEGRARAPAEARVTGSERRLRYPEWDHRSRAYVEDGVTVHLRLAPEGDQGWVDRTLAEHRTMLELVRRRFEMLKAQRTRLRRQFEGEEPDLEACVDGLADFRAGLPMPQGLYQSWRAARRDMAILVLTDVSGSTDGWIAAGRRIVDVEREALLLVAVALQGMNEPSALQAFSGEGPHGVVVRELKRFDEPFGDVVARRIASLEPERYTRAGAALRHATATLMGQGARHRLLLLLSDGKPNDMDDYEGRYGVEDMRQAVTEARLQGINCFCLTVDRQAAAYLPGIFGPHQYALLPKPALLPTALLEWMKRLVTA